jgi:hypothetical protein
MALNRFFGYFGAKHVLAPHYPAPLHGTIIEPFAGSAGYATRYHWHRVILMEKDPDVAGIWRWLIGASARDVLDLPLLTPGQSIDELEVCREARALIGLWLGSGDAAARGRRRRSSWSERNLAEGVEDSWCRSIRARLAMQVDKIRHWQIIEGDYSQAPDVEATWFIDPPYALAGKRKRYRCSAADIDFAALGQWCRSRRGQVIACESAGATWLPFSPFREIQGVRDAGASSSTEAIWTNDPA